VWKLHNNFLILYRQRNDSVISVTQDYTHISRYHECRLLCSYTMIQSHKIINIFHASSSSVNFHTHCSTHRFMTGLYPVECSRLANRMVYQPVYCHWENSDHRFTHNCGRLCVIHAMFTNPRPSITTFCKRKPPR
jgi:hypothetical protein